VLTNDDPGALSLRPSSIDCVYALSGLPAYMALRLLFACDVAGVRVGAPARRCRGQPGQSWCRPPRFACVLRHWGSTRRGNHTAVMQVLANVRSPAMGPDPEITSVRRPESRQGSFATGLTAAATAAHLSTNTLGNDELGWSSSGLPISSATGLPPQPIIMSSGDLCSPQSRYPLKKPGKREHLLIWLGESLRPRWTPTRRRCLRASSGTTSGSGLERAHYRLVGHRPYRRRSNNRVALTPMKTAAAGERLLEVAGDAAGIVFLSRSTVGSYRRKSSSTLTGRRLNRRRQCPGHLGLPQSDCSPILRPPTSGETTRRSGSFLWTTCLHS